MDSLDSTYRTDAEAAAAEAMDRQPADDGAGPASSPLKAKPAKRSRHRGAASCAPSIMIRNGLWVRPGGLRLVG